MAKGWTVFLSTPIFAVMGRAGGMIIPFFIAYCYGVSKETDAFFFSYAFVFFAGALFQQVLESVLVPYFAEQRLLGRGRDFAMAIHVAGNMWPWVLGVSLLLSWLMYQSLETWSGLQGAAVPLAAALFLEMIPFLILSVWASAFNGLFNTRKIFWYPAVSPLIRSAVVVLILFLFHNRLGIHALSLGFTIGEGIRCALSVLLLRSHGGLGAESTVFDFAWRGSALWRKIGLPVAAMAGVQMTTLLNQWFATWLGSGDVTLFSYADRLFMIPSQIFIAGMSQIFLASWSEASMLNKPVDFKARVSRDTAVVFGAALAVSLLLWAFREPFVRLAYGYGDFDESRIPVVADTFGWLILGFAPGVLNGLYLRLLFVFKKPLFFFYQSWIKLIALGLLNYALGAVLGIEGIAAATSLTTLAGAVWILFYIEKRMPDWTRVKA